MTHDETLRWTPILDTAIAAFGETPGAQLEQEAIDAFRDDPEHVARLLERIATQHATKHFDSPWGIFRAELRKPKHDIVASTAAGKTKRVENAKRWIANAGCHYDRQQDVEAELFGDDYQRGRLHDYRSDDKLHTELIAYWHEQRPRGEQAERNHEAWAQHCVESRARVQAMIAAKRQEDECAPSSTSPSKATHQTNSESDNNSPSTEPSPSTASPPTSSTLPATTPEPNGFQESSPSTSTPTTSPSTDPDAIPHFTPTPTGAST